MGFLRDKYTRTIADVLLPDGTNVNYTLDDQALFDAR
jgi:hypothetical protein